MTKTAKEWAELYDSPEFRKKEAPNTRDLGASCQFGGSTIKLWSPVAESVTVNFYKDGEPTTKSYWSEPMTLGEGGVWSYYIRESLHLAYYDFTLIIDGETVQSPDPYAVSAGVNGIRSQAIDFHLIQPDGWNQDKAPAYQTETVIDEAHIKELSWDPSGGWPESVRGKYLALTHPDTSLNNAGVTPTGLAFFKNLGITHLQLMPVYDYGSVDEAGDDHQFNWGYDPVNYNVPDGSYSSDPHHGEVRLIELKRAIMGIHQVGLRVIMDVVYNHTYNMESPLQKTMPYYFYRVNADGSLSNGSGCGNDIASERAMVHKYIVDSILFWAKQYHMDGFRFDLMGLLTVDLMNDIQAKLDAKYGPGEKLLYGEPWSADQTAVSPDVRLANKASMGELSPEIGMFCDDTRDAIKGSAGDKKATGFVNGADGLEVRILNAARGWVVEGSNVQNPGQIINYVSAHDNQTLWDKLTETTPDEDLRRRQYRLAAAIYLTCQGRPFMLSGATFLRTKHGNDNSHNAPIEINHLDWNAAATEAQMVRYYTGLIALRKSLPGLCDKSTDAESRIYNTWTRPGMVGFMVDNDADDSTSPYSELIIVYNRNATPSEVELAEGDWEILATETDSYGWQNPSIVNGHVNVAGIGWIMLGTRDNGPASSNDEGKTN